MIRIRTATADDQDLLTQLIAASYATLDPGLYRDGELASALPVMSRASPALLASGTYFVVEVDGEAGACGGWTFGEPGSGRLEPGVAHVRHFATHPRHRRKGLARDLLQHCLADAAGRGATSMRCWSTRDAEGFYRSAGFNRLREVEVAMGAHARLESVEMVRRLT